MVSATRGVLTAKRTPSRMSWAIDRPDAARGRPCAPTANSATMTGTNEAALR